MSLGWRADDAVRSVAAVWGPTPGVDRGHPGRDPAGRGPAHTQPHIHQGHAA